MLEGIIGISFGLILFLVIVYFAIIAMFYKKIPQGQALIRTGFKGTK
ncbi:MAG: flotillin, partial [Planctomycetota bacterium]